MKNIVEQPWLYMTRSRNTTKRGVEKERIKAFFLSERSGCGMKGREKNEKQEKGGPIHLQVGGGL